MRISSVKTSLHTVQDSYRSGTYVWGNSPPEKPFRKVIEGRKLFDAFVESLNDHTEVDEIIARLMEIGTNDTE